MLRIFIQTDDWKEVDFEDVNLALNDAMINITNPLKMSTEYSKTVAFPLTAHNRDVFEHYERLDSLVTTSMDPSKAIPIRVECDGNIVFEGYFALTKVDIGNNRIEGNMYSYINVWVNRMRQLTWDDFPALLPDDFSINRNTVYTSWTSARNRNSAENELYIDVTWPTSSGLDKNNWMYHIGFVPTANGEPAQFSADKIVGVDGTIKDVWEGMGLTGNAKTTADAILKKPTERQMLQFRSYEQKPFIFINWLCKLLQYYCTYTPGMPSLEFDEDWARYSNPNWHDLVYVLPSLLKEDSDAVTQSVIYALEAISYYSDTTNAMSQNNTTARTFNSGPISLSAPTDTEYDIITSAGWIEGDGKSIDYILPLNIVNNYQMVRNWSTQGSEETNNAWAFLWNQKLRMCGDAKCYVGLVYDNGTQVAGSETLMATWNGSNAGTITPSKTTETVSTYQRRTTYDWSFSKNATYTWSGILTQGLNARPYIRWEFKNYNYGWTGVNDYTSAYIMFYAQGAQGQDEYYDMMYVSDAVNPTMHSFMKTGWNVTTADTPQQYHRIKYASAARSGKRLSMKELWYTENENSIFNVFLKYLKAMNLVIVYDNFYNKLTVLPREKWMQQGFNAGVEDWTDKVDYKKDISFKPLNWEDKFVELNYETVDVDKLKDFNDKYGYTYGTKRIETSYSFNANTKKLLEDADKINASGELTEYCYTLADIKTITDNLGSATVIVEPKLPTEAWAINKKGESEANITNCFFYYETSSFDGLPYALLLPSWDTSLQKKINGTAHNYIYITDDSQYENNNGTYCFQPVWDKTYSSNEYTGNDALARRVPISIGRPTLSHYIERKIRYNDIVSGTTTMQTTPYCCLFSQPREDYFNPEAVTRNSNDIYTTRWSNLIPELYNEQNKLLTCKVYLTPKDYNQFKFNKFIYIDGVLYLVNKIIDYNPNSTQATKCELIQVMNPSAYTTSPLVNSTSTTNGGIWRRGDILPIIN